MTITLDLTPEEETRLKAVASIRGVKPEAHAHDVLANLLRDAFIPQQPRRPGKKEWEGLITAAKSGDVAARLQLIEMAPPIATHNPVTGEPYRAISDEALRRENVHEDRD